MALQLVSKKQCDMGTRTGFGVWPRTWTCRNYRDTGMPYDKGEWNKPGAEQSDLDLLPSWVPLSPFTLRFSKARSGYKPNGFI